MSGQTLTAVILVTHPRETFPDTRASLQKAPALRLLAWQDSGGGTPPRAHVKGDRGRAQRGDRLSRHELGQAGVQLSAAGRCLGPVAAPFVELIPRGSPQRHTGSGQGGRQGSCGHFLMRKWLGRRVGSLQPSNTLGRGLTIKAEAYIASVARPPGSLPRRNEHF